MYTHWQGRVLALLVFGGAWASALAQTSGPAAGAPQRGAAVFEQCRICHSYGPGAAHLVGPNLWQIVGSDIASRTDFAYSPALRSLQGEWSPQALDAFLKQPAQYAPGTRMVFGGLADDQMRSDLIAFLAAADDTRAGTLPEADLARPVPSPDDRFGDDWPPGDGREETGVLCSGCHSLAIVKQQGLSREDWDDLLVWMVEEQGMPEPSGAVREKILVFLSENYGRDRKR